MISTEAKCKGEQLGTSLSSYTSDKNIKSINRVSNSVSIGGNVNNRLKNHSAETSSDDWKVVNTGASTATGEYAKDVGYIGNSSFKLATTKAATNSYIQYYQTLGTDRIVPGTTYTFSGYVKTKEFTTLQKNTSGATLVVTCKLSNGKSKQYYSDYITETTEESVNSGWRRLNVTFTPPETTTSTKIALLSKEAKGTVYYDALQVEKGEAVNDYNLLENASLEDSTILSGYESSNLTIEEGKDYTTTTSEDGASAFKIIGEKGKQKWFSQEVAVSGKEADSYVVSGWAKAIAAGKTFLDGSSENERLFEISVKVTYSDGTEVLKDSAEFSPEVVNWQYAASTFDLSDGDDSSAKQPTKITLYVRYDYQMNCAIFDHLSLIKQPVSQYSYSEDGELTSVSTDGDEELGLEYTDGNVTAVTDSDGNETTLSYDSEDNVTEVEDKSGVSTSVEYNDAGSVTKQVVQSMPSAAVSQQMVTETSYTDNGAYVATQTDEDGYTTTSSYDANKGVANSVTDANGNTTNYTYDANTDEMTAMTGTVDGNEVNVQYTYSDSQIKKILHNGFEYNFTYDAFGNNTSVKVGDTNLVSYEYEENNGEVSKVTYGNGDYNNFTYDLYGNLSSVSVNGETRYQWSADNSGTVTKQVDLKNNLEYNYEYNNGTLVRENILDTSKASNTGRTLYSLEYGTSSTGKTSTFINSVNGLSMKHTYTNDDNGNLSEYTLPTSSKITYSYDGLNRLSSFVLGATSPVDISYTYADSARNMDDSSTYTTNKIETETIGDTTYEYEYDKVENITKIYKTEGSNDKVLEKSYSYNEISELTRVNDLEENVTKVYNYDEGGNITSVSFYKYTTGDLGTKLRTKQYTYSDTTWKDKLTSINGIEITYDEIGNPTSYFGMEMEWDNGRELSSLVGEDVEETYTYDSDGLRVSKTVNDEKTTYEYVDGQLWYEKKGDSELYYFYDSNDTLVAIQYVKADGTTENYYVATNMQGDVTQIYNESGSLSAQYVYDSFGVVIAVVDGNGKSISDQKSIGRMNSIRYRGYS